MDSLRRELTLLVLSRYPLVVMESADEARVEELVGRVAADLGLPLWTWSSTGGLVRGAGGPGAAGGSTGRLADTSDPERALARLAGVGGELVVLCHDLHPYLDRPEVARRLRELERLFSGGRSTLVLSGVAVELPAALRHGAARLEVALPGPEELEGLVRDTAAELARQRRARVQLTDEAIAEMARALTGLHREEARRLLYRAALEDGRLGGHDLPRLLDGKRRRVGESGALAWVEPAADGLAALGGAAELKRWIERRREAFGEAARRFGLDPPRGLLLAGVPGTGKSLACRALAGEWRLPLLALDAGGLYDKYVGETEANLRRALAAAEAMAPAILWIDEIEKALAAGGEGGGGGDAGLSQRVRGTLLTWLQERPAPVFVAATANDVSRLPVELLRRGRFDEVFFFDLPGEAERAHVLGLHLARRDRRPEDFDLAEVARATKGFSGAELEGLVVAALYHAFAERRPLSTEILLEEAAATRPLSRLRPADVDALRAWGRRHARPA